jgi:hypothetical protein
LRAHGLRRVTSDGVRVSWSAVKGRLSYDITGIREAAAKAGVDVAKFERTGEPSDRLTIQVVEQRPTT